MTAREKYIEERCSNAKCIRIGECLPPECPADYGYLDDPSWCDPDGSRCRDCWDREISEVKER